MVPHVNAALKTPIEEPENTRTNSRPKYNKYVLQCLDEIKQTDDERQLEIYLLLYHLDSNLNYEGDIPF